MCRMLHVHPSGFYAWLKKPFSKRAREDQRQTERLKEAWQDSGKIYGYRKLHDDLRDQGETYCPNRSARLARSAGIKAQIGSKRRRAEVRRSGEDRVRRCKAWCSPGQ